MTDESPDVQPVYGQVHDEVKRYDEDKRYFKVEEGYDKRLYENDWKNIIKIIAIFVFYYACNIVVFMG